MQVRQKTIYYSVHANCSCIKLKKISYIKKGATPLEAAPQYLLIDI